MYVLLKYCIKACVSAYVYNMCVLCVCEDGYILKDSNLNIYITLL